jgi:glycosyltransferase involved in cell wall biosynthesis
LTEVPLQRGKTRVNVLFLTNEYPPNIYGGAGVHVGYLSRELAKTIPVEVRCFGNQRLEEGNLKVIGFELDTSNFTCPKPLRSAFGAVRRCTDFNTMNIDSNLVHCHTWYSHFGGILAKKNYGLPLVITVHSLEPLRPWKREQLAGGYDFSLGVEKTALEMADAIIAVSVATKHDIERLFNVDPARVRVIHNGIDLNQYRKVESTSGARNPIHGSRFPDRAVCSRARHAATGRGNADRCRTRKSAAAGNHLDQRNGRSTDCG